MNKRIKKKKRKQQIVFVKMCKIESNGGYILGVAYTTYPFPKEISVIDCSGTIVWK